MSNKCLWSTHPSIHGSLSQLPQGEGRVPPWTRHHFIIRVQHTEKDKTDHPFFLNASCCAATWRSGQTFLNSSHSITPTGGENKKTDELSRKLCYTVDMSLSLSHRAGRVYFFIVPFLNNLPLTRKHTMAVCSSFLQENTQRLYRRAQAQPSPPTVWGGYLMCEKRPPPCTDRFRLHAAQNGGGKFKNNHLLPLGDVSGKHFDTMTASRACLECEPPSLGCVVWSDRSRKQETKGRNAPLSPPDAFGCTRAQRPHWRFKCRRW